MLGMDIAWKAAIAIILASNGAQLPVDKVAETS
jgi:hypothetical protein